MAQLVEQMTLNHWVVGSSPTGVTERERFYKTSLFIVIGPGSIAYCPILFNRFNLQYMRQLYYLSLKVLRKLYSSIKGSKRTPLMAWAIKDPNKASDIIYNVLSRGKPCMIARYGATEINSIANYIGVSNNKHDALGFIKGKAPQWWWNASGMKQMAEWSGFFPATPEYLSRFGKMMIEDSKELDVLGSWQENEKYFQDIYGNIPQIALPYLEPFHSVRPWTRYLKDKRVVVVHPFASAISQQYNRRGLLFENKDILPDFKSFRVIPAVQSLGGKCDRFKDWFEALDWMKSELDREEYDVALIGCGAYGFPLAAHSKRTGHQAIHLAGALQLLFGIKGNRWENDGQCRYWNMPLDSYKKLFNPHWIRPGVQDRPDNVENVEGGGLPYW